MTAGAELDNAFLTAGLRHFPDAYAAVTAFRRVIAEAVEVALQTSRPDVWRPAQSKPTRSESNGLWVGANGIMALEGVAGKTVAIDVGIWWNASHFDSSRVAVAAVYSAKEIIGRQLNAPDPTGGPGVRLTRNGSRQDYFFIPLDDAVTDIPAALQCVVDAAADSVAAAMSARSGVSEPTP